MTRLRLLITTWFGSGYLPVSGTAGTAAAIPLILLLWWLPSPWLHAAAIPVVAALGVWAAADAEERWGRKDPSQVVIDEAAGFVVATAFVQPGPGTLAAAFFLFRLFDILKPWPAGRLERLSGARGIMADDLTAGLYANLALQILLHFWGTNG